MKNLNRLFFGAILILSNLVHAQDGLFISEITDPADDYSGRFVELFNAGSEPIDFSTTTIYLSRQSNGGTGWGDVQLAGTISPGETFVIGGSGFETLYGFPPDQVSGILIGNGDDAYFLYRDGDHSAGVLHDIYGVIDTDGTGEPWEYEDSRALRVESIIAPNTNWTITEWEITSANIADVDPGTHHGTVVVDTLPSQDSISLSIINDTVNLGQPVEVPVEVSRLTTADNIISYQFDVEYDNFVLEYSGVDIIGTIAEGGSIAVNTGITGKLSISYMNSTPLEGTGDILKLQFNSLIADTTAISLSNAYLNNIPVPDVTNGHVIIMVITAPTAVISYNDTSIRFADTLMITATFNEPMHPGNDVLISLNGAANLNNAVMDRQDATIYTYPYLIPKSEGDVTVRLGNGTDVWGTVLDPVPTAGDTFSIIKFVPGDVDDDGLILAYDAAITLQYSVGLDPLQTTDPLPWENWRDSTANVDGLGDITAYDAGLILQYSAGIISSFPGEANKSVSSADVTVELVENAIVFYSYGELIGLNLSTLNANEILGKPIIPDERFMSAFNNSGDSLKVGLCTAYPAESGTVLMKIPYNHDGTITFKMLVNTDKRFLTLNLPTGLPKHENIDISVYPNPARNRLFINTGKYCRLDGFHLRIINQIGTCLYKTEIKEPGYEINISDLSGPGLYYLQVIEKNGRITGTRKIIIE